jgi:Fe2+ or Zn2+ uptake regulation protein
MGPQRRARIYRLAVELTERIDRAESATEPLSEALLRLLREHPDGLTRQQILKKLGLKGNRSDEDSVSDALNALTKTNHVSARDRKYLPE